MVEWLYVEQTQSNEKEKNKQTKKKKETLHFEYPRRLGDVTRKNRLIVLRMRSQTRFLSCDRYRRIIQQKRRICTLHL